MLTIAEAGSALRATPGIGLADIEIRAGVHAAEYVPAAAVVWGIRHNLRRSGIHCLQNAHN